MAKPILSGSIDQRPVPEVLAEVCRRGEDGVLRFRRGKTEKAVFFQRGAIIFASSNSPDDRLGELLLRKGLISYAAFEARMRSIEPGKRLGTLFVESGAISSKQLIEGVLGQVQEILYSLFDWEDGSYSWEPGELPSEEVITLQMSNQDVILEGIRRVTRWSVIRSGIGELATSYRRAEGLESRLPRLTDSEREVLALLERPLTLEALCKASRLSDFETCRLLLGLKLVGLVAEAPPAVPAPEPFAAQPEPIAAGPEQLPLAEIWSVLANDPQVAGEPQVDEEPPIPEASRVLEEASQPAPGEGYEAPVVGEGQTARQFELGQERAEPASTWQDIFPPPNEEQLSPAPSAPNPWPIPTEGDVAAGPDAPEGSPLPSRPNAAPPPSPPEPLLAPAEKELPPPQAPDQQELVRQVEAFNEIHRFVYELLRYELGAGVSHFVARTLSQVRAAHLDLLAEASYDQAGALSAQPVVAAGLRLGKTDLDPTLGALLEAELEAIQGLLGEKKARIILQGVEELRKRQSQTTKE